MKIDNFMWINEKYTIKNKKVFFFSKQKSEYVITKIPVKVRM